MPRGFSTDPIAGSSDPARGVPWLRVVVQAEVVALLILAVAVTVAPQVVLDWVAVAATTARGFSSSYRSGVALVGLLFVVAAALGLWALVRPRPGAATGLEAMRDGAMDAAGEAEGIGGRGKRRVA